MKVFKWFSVQIRLLKFLKRKISRNERMEELFDRKPDLDQKTTGRLIPTSFQVEIFNSEKKPQNPLKHLH